MVFQQKTFGNSTRAPRGNSGKPLPTRRIRALTGLRMGRLSRILMLSRKSKGPQQPSTSSLSCAAHSCHLSTLPPCARPTFAQKAASRLRSGLFHHAVHGEPGYDHHHCGSGVSGVSQGSPGAMMSRREDVRDMVGPFHPKVTDGHPLDQRIL